MNEESSTSLETHPLNRHYLQSGDSHYVVAGAQRKSTFFCQPTFPHPSTNSNGKQIQRKGSEVILFSSTEKDARKLMLREHLLSLFYQMTRTQSNINVNSKHEGEVVLETGKCLQEGF